MTFNSGIAILSVVKHRGAIRTRPSIRLNPSNIKKMANKKKYTRTRRNTKSATSGKKSPLALRDPKDAAAIVDEGLHVYGRNNDNVCLTNGRGHATPGNRSPLELRFDATEGFIPVWGPNATLHWRFNEASMRYFQNPGAAKQAIREFFGEAVDSWGDASPVRFTERNDNWDFELTMLPNANCSASGCTLARAFFPDSGRHDIAMYPTLFEQSREEVVETLIHEIGHVYGLRHFFANVSETQWASVPFGSQSPFTIMNYGAQSVLTEADRSDLALFYAGVWSGELTEINNTPITQFRPFHEFLPTAAVAGMAPQIPGLAASRRCTSCGAFTV